MRLVIFLFLITFTLSANHVSWYGDFNTAHQEALEQNKMLLVLLIQKDCLTCKEAIRTSFINQSYIKEINQKFISVLITQGQKNSYPIEMFYTSSYPSLFFLDKHELFICEALRDDITPKRVQEYLTQCLP